MINSSNLTFFHQDVLGNFVTLPDSVGNLIEQYRYTVLGEPSVYNASGIPKSTASPTSAFLFTARKYDPETTLYHYRARAYSPELGRFTQLDPIDVNGLDGNFYRYVANNPVNWIEPDGLQGVPSPSSVTSNPTIAAEAAAAMEGITVEQYLARQALEKATQVCQKQLAKHGKKSLERMIKPLDKQIQKHLDKLKKDPTSQSKNHWEKEIRNFETQKQAAQDVLKSAQ